MTAISPITSARTLALAVTVFASAISCGSGGGGTFGGGIGGSGLVFGPITGFGSIIVNDSEIDTSVAMVTINGQPADADDLRLGMVVTVTGDADTDGLVPLADLVEFESVLEGPIDAINPADALASVLADTVVVDRNTVLDGVDFDPSAVGAIVSVSGLVDADGTIRATRIALRNGGSGFVLSGIVRRLDPVAATFRLRDLTIDFASAVGAAGTETPLDELRDGLAVRVAFSSRPVGKVIRADEIRARRAPVEQEVDAAMDKTIRLRGFVTRRPSAAVFVVNELVRVRIVGQTRFVGGDAGDIARNVAVGVVGRLTADRVVIAEVIELRNADVSPIDPAS